MATIEQLEAALRKADAAGNVEDARALANAIRQARGAAPKATAKPNFSNVSASVRTTEEGGGDLAPSSMAAGAPLPPSLDEINAENRRLWNPAAFERNQVEATARAYHGLPAPVRFAAGVGEPVDRLLRGTVQLFEREPERDLSSLITSNRPTPMQRQEARARAIADATVKSDAAGNLGRFGGDVALAAVPLSRATAATRLGRLATAAATGGAYAGLQPVVQGESREGNVGLGALLGLAGQTGSDVLMASGKRAAEAITPEMRKLVAAAQARGITLTPAQLSNSPLVKRLAAMADRMTFGRNPAAAEQRAAFNREVAAEIGENAPAVTPEVYARAKARQSAQFNDLTGRNSLNVSPDLVRTLEGIRSEAAMAGDDAQKAVDNALAAFYQRATDVPGQMDGATSAVLGNMPGRAYQALDSQLGQVTKLGTPASHYVGQVRSAIRSAMDDSIAPEDAAAWRLLRQQYGNRKTIRDLVAKGDGGELSPAALMGRVTANNAGKEAMASGNRGGLGELARIGQLLKDPSSSGTAENLLASQALNPIAWPVIAGSALLGKTGQRVINSNGLTSRGLAALLLREGRGKSRQALAPVARAAAMVATPAATEKTRKKPQR